MNVDDEEFFLMILAFVLAFIYLFHLSVPGAITKTVHSYYLLWVDYYTSSLFFASIFISVLLLVGLIYSVVSLGRVRAKVNQKLYHPEGPLQKLEETSPLGAKKWAQVERHMASENPGEWRLAIFEADILLDDLLDSLGYFGNSLGEKLKQIPSGDFRTLNDAWEAHKIRNSLAHEGASFLLSDREARRVIGLYERVFREHGYI